MTIVAACNYKRPFKILLKTTRLSRARQARSQSLPVSANSALEPPRRSGGGEAKSFRRQPLRQIVVRPLLLNSQHHGHLHTRFHGLGLHVTLVFLGRLQLDPPDFAAENSQLGSHPPNGCAVRARSLVETIPQVPLTRTRSQPLGWNKQISAHNEISHSLNSNA